MRLLLDTHAALWFVSGDRRLGRQLDAIRDPANDVFVSMVSLMEVAVKQRIGKLRVDLDALLSEFAEQGFEFLPLTPRHVLELAKLPVHPEHKDPFDHQLIAQAIAENLTFVSQDRHAASYSVRLLPTG
ncbi:MAG TPA: type II toxin-antitoxin system VapC family toxin [Rhodospirillaceae bacterium]|nr:type II toxin-antitoxin system VapC family toxin [Rhodospirillaceae bacterium]